MYGGQLFKFLRKKPSEVLALFVTLETCSDYCTFSFIVNILLMRLD